MVSVDSESFLAIVAVAALAALVSGLLSSRLVVPVVVLEILAGILIGPSMLDLAEPDPFIAFFSDLGLGMLFFFAGYEIDFERITRQPLRLALLGWAISLALAYSLGGLLALAGVVLSLLFTGSALATTAIGTLIPILSDAGELRTRFGTYLLAAGAVGEFGPILLITLVFSTKRALDNALILLAFVAGRGRGRHRGARGRAGLERCSSARSTASRQLPVRLAVVLVFALGALASQLGLDLLLGGFVAGIITRLALKRPRGRGVRVEADRGRVRLLHPVLLRRQRDASFDLTRSRRAPARVLKVPLFFVLFLVVRGVPAMLLYRRILDLRDRVALALLARPSCRSWSRSRRSRSTAGTCGRRPPPRSSAPPSSRRRSIPLLGLRLRGDRAALSQT